MDPGTVLRGEARVNQHVCLGVIHQRRQLGHRRPQLVGDLVPLLGRPVGIVLYIGGADSGRDDATPGLAGRGYGVAHEMHAAAPPSGAEQRDDGRLQSLMGIGIDSHPSAARTKQPLDDRPLCAGLEPADPEAPASRIRAM